MFCGSVSRNLAAAPLPARCEQLQGVRLLAGMALDAVPVDLDPQSGPFRDLDVAVDDPNGRMYQLPVLRQIEPLSTRFVRFISYVHINTSFYSRYRAIMSECVTFGRQAPRSRQ